MATNAIAGTAGLPQLSIPAASVPAAGGAELHPVGLSLIGWPGGDEALLRLAEALEPFCEARFIHAQG
jgi:Asp-tRNA(Asn)/Glu-tRNA(Gln) amidotransferase A subunit family amidase